MKRIRVAGLTAPANARGGSGAALRGVVILQLLAVAAVAGLIAAPPLPSSASGPLKPGQRAVVDVAAGRGRPLDASYGNRGLFERSFVSPLPHNRYPPRRRRAGSSVTPRARCASHALRAAP